MTNTDIAHTTAVETAEERMARLGITEVSASRMESLRIAHADVDDATFAAIGACDRLARKSSIVLPAVDLQRLSRGRGWCRSKDGVFGDRADDVGYRVGSGRWTVYGSDGFRRERREQWRVRHLSVGVSTWTIASAV